MVEVKENTELLAERLENYLNTQGLRDELPMQLYHYTSYSGLQGILKNRCLKLTDHNHLDDPTEIVHGKNILLSMLDSQLQKQEALTHYLKKVINWITENYYKTYILSFCSEGDYVPAWRDYGEDGHGFSIGFKKNYFEVVNKNYTSKVCALFKVRYDDIILKKDLARMLEIAHEIQPNWPTQPYPNNYLSVLISAFLSTLPKVKNPNYKAEREWRFCKYILHNHKNLDALKGVNESGLSLSDIKIFIEKLPHNGDHVSALEFNYSDIDTIYIGQQNNFSSSKKDIESLLKNLSIPPEIIKNIQIQKSRAI